MADGAAAGLDPVLLEVIACPVCHGSLAPRGDLLVCAGCGRRYPVRDGVPVLLEDDALPPDALPVDAPPADDTADEGDSP